MSRGRSARTRSRCHSRGRRPPSALELSFPTKIFPPINNIQRNVSSSATRNLRILVRFFARNPSPNKANEPARVPASRHRFGRSVERQGSTGHCVSRGWSRGDTRSRYLVSRVHVSHVNHLFDSFYALFTVRRGTRVVYGARATNKYYVHQKTPPAPKKAVQPKRKPSAYVCSRPFGAPSHTIPQKTSTVAASVAPRSEPDAQARRLRSATSSAASCAAARNDACSCGPDSTPNERWP